MHIRSRVLIIMLLSFLFAGVTACSEKKPVNSILLFGDSIIAGYGLQEQDSLSVKLTAYLAQHGKPITIINGGVSGDTTEDGRKRLAATLEQYQPDVVFLALGANDMLRHESPKETRKNLAAMLEILKEKDVPVILSRVKAPANYGVDYMTEFNETYDDLAAQYDVPVYPFLLSDILHEPLLMQQDRVHPTADGVAVIAKALGKYLLDYVP